MIWDWEFAAEVFPQILEAFVEVTLGLTAAAGAIAIALGLVLALGRRSHIMWVSWPTYGIVEFVRSTPIPIQLFLVYFGLPEVGIRLSAWVTGVAVLGVHYAAYMSEVYRAGIDAIPKGQWEASTALSLSPRRTWQAVVLPQVVRRVLPSMGNQIIALFKETPFVIVISLAEMVTTAEQIGGSTFRYLEPLTIAGFIFLLASYPTSVLMRRLEIRLGHA
ncbi:MAG TPA: ectoine/hydroxyectoine ABC transporter permease subunit EhuD [Nocardioidaceae bacterium]|nr:ectoine/hydroxyectoine ABC transporter permease subunit EhuD [Nocardioidaceae bacterium]